MTNQDLLAEAMTHHAAGRLDLAEVFYRARLETNANHPEANHGLGALEIERGRIEAGLRGPTGGAAIASRMRTGISSGVDPRFLTRLKLRLGS